MVLQTLQYHRPHTARPWPSPSLLLELKPGGQLLPRLPSLSSPSLPSSSHRLSSLLLWAVSKWGVGGALISLDSPLPPPTHTHIGQPSRRRPPTPHEGQVMALPLGSEQAPRAGVEHSGVGCGGAGASPSWAGWRPFTHIPRGEGRGQGGGPGASGQWTGIQAYGCHAVEMRDARPGAPEVPPLPPLPLLPSVTLHPHVSVFVHICVSLWAYVSLPPTLFSLASPLSPLRPFVYFLRGAAPLWEPGSQKGRWLGPGRPLA